MSLHKIYIVICDRADCHERAGPAQPTSKAARQIARAQNWKRVAGSTRAGADFCSLHAPDHPEAK